MAGGRVITYRSRQISHTRQRDFVANRRGHLMLYKENALGTYPTLPQGKHKKFVVIRDVAMLGFELGV